MRWLSCAVVAGIAVASVSLAMAEMQSQGVLQGNVEASPTCPGPARADQPCIPRPIQTTIDIYLAATERGEAATNEIAASIITDGGGRFRLVVAPGRYKLLPRPSNVGASGKPAYVTVTAGMTTVLTLTVDTGLR